MARNVVTSTGRYPIDGDILINARDPRDPEKTLLLAAQTIQGAATAASALRYHGLEVTVRVWNGKAYCEERI